MHHSTTKEVSVDKTKGNHIAGLKCRSVMVRFC